MDKDIDNVKDGEGSEWVQIECTYESKIFYNPANKYCIVKMATSDITVPVEARSSRIYPDNQIRFTAVGYELPFTDAVKLVLEGVWEKGKYGMQLQVEQWKEVIPETESGVYNYLSSGLLKGIGSATAAEIVSRFGVDSLRVIEQEPEKLLDIRGITPERLEEIKRSYAESRTLRHIITLLAPFKLTPKAATKIYQFFGPACLDILKQSPYTLCRVPGFGFTRVDGIVQKNGCDLHDPMRAQGAIFCALQNAGIDGGHLYLEKPKLIAETLQLLNGRILAPSLRVKQEEIESALENMILEGIVVSTQNNIYTPRVFNQEDTVARIIAKLLIEKPPQEDISLILENVKRDLNVKLSAKQEDAVNAAFRNNISIITGSPGTGKTTVLKTILEVYRRLYPDKKIQCMAPTGRASRNMAESTGFKDAGTMHSHLGITNEEDDTPRNNGPLDAELIVVDENSMVDMWLSWKFFSRVRRRTKLILVGDPDQLPSVGAGNVFKEMIQSGIIPVTVLDQIFRQSGDSFIAHNAKIINRGETNLYYGDDFQFINTKTQEEAAMYIMELYCQEVYEHGIENVQILSPFRSRGEASAEQLNATLREIINPFASAEDELRVGGKTFRIGDRIMQTQNTPKVSNGDLGFIRAVNNGTETSAEVDFGEGRRYTYRPEDLTKLELSYATTIHKAMGSQYDVVIIPLLKTQMIMLNRNLLYTAITRAKKKVILVGQKPALFMAIHCNDITKRNTMLGERACLYYQAYAKEAGITLPIALQEKLKKAS